MQRILKIPVVIDDAFLWVIVMLQLSRFEPFHRFFCAFEVALDLLACHHFLEAETARLAIEWLAILRISEAAPSVAL